MQSEAGKGDNPRPFSVPLKEFEKNFEHINWGTREREQKELENREEE